MNNTTHTLVLAFTLVALAACGQSDQTTDDAGNTVDEMMQDARSEAEQAVDAAREGMGEAAKEAGEMVDTARDEVSSSWP